MSIWFNHAGNLIDIRIYGMCILVVGHEKKCPCSYCKNEDGKYGYGFTFPKCKASNAWRVFSWTTTKYRWYLRWTLPSRKRYLVEKRYRESLKANRI